MRDEKKERKKGAQKKAGENSPISPPLDPRLRSVHNRLRTNNLPVWSQANLAFTSI